MTTKLVLGKEARIMSTDNGVPRVGDTVEFARDSLAKVTAVRWNLYGAPDDDYKPGFITHQAVVTLVAVKASRR